MLGADRHLETHRLLGAEPGLTLNECAINTVISLRSNNDRNRENFQHEKFYYLNLSFFSDTNDNKIKRIFRREGDIHPFIASSQNYRQFQSA